MASVASLVASGGKIGLGRVIKGESKVSRDPIIKLDGNKPFVKVFPETGTWFVYHPNWLEEEADYIPDDLLKVWIKDIDWIDEKGFFGNAPCSQKKWYGDFNYNYSGTFQKKDSDFPVGMRDVMKIAEKWALKQSEEYDVEKKEKGWFNYSGVLCRLYKDGNSSLSFHSDAESTLKPLAPIVSLTLGQSRIFKLRALRTKEHLQMAKTGGKIPSTIYAPLKHGSLFIMGGTCQKHWVHAVEKDTSTKPRINLTFRAFNDIVTIGEELEE